MTLPALPPLEGGWSRDFKSLVQVSREVFGTAIQPLGHPRSIDGGAESERDPDKTHPRNWIVTRIREWQPNSKTGYVVVAGTINRHPPNAEKWYFISEEVLDRLIIF